MSGVPRKCTGNSARRLEFAVTEDADRFEVDAVIGKKGHGPTTKYLVKWVGYDEATWQPVSDLDHCPDLITDFEKTEASKMLIFKSELKAKRLHRETSPTNPEKRVRSTNHLPTLWKTEPDCGLVGDMVVTTSLNDQESSDITRPSTSSSVSSRLSTLEVEPVYRRRQQYIVVAEPGESGIEQGHMVVQILAHKPRELKAFRLEDVDFLVNYAGEAPNEFVAYEVCIRKIPTYVADYMARNHVLSFYP